MDYTLVLIDNPAPHVRRVTLNRPEKRNALNSVLRQEVITAVRAGESDPDVRVTVIAANGPSFCGGYDLTQNVTQAGTATPAADYPYVGAGGFQRSVVDLRFGTPDMQYHAWLMGMRQALRAGTELSIVNSGSEGGREFIDNIRKLGLTEALNIRDAAFQDGRTITAHSQD
jgi:enoyl-CoA hydratase